MLRVRGLVPLLALLLIPAPAGATLLSEPDCDDRLPQVLNVGLPRARNLPDFREEAVRKAAERTFEKLYRGSGRCAGRRRLQVNIAVGNDYQILDWLGRDLIDVAVVPSLSLYLLGRDEVDLLELDLAETADGLLPPPATPWLRSPSPDPMADLSAFREGLWCESLEKTEGGSEALAAERRRCAGRRVDPDSIALPSHLSTAGFLAPVAGISAWREEKAGSLKLSEKEADSLRDRFWTSFFEHARFTIEEEEPGPAGERRLIEIAAGPGPEREGGWVRLGTESYRDHLVISRRAADEIFAFTPAQARRPAPLPASLGNALRVLDRKAPLAAFQSLFVADPHLGVRTFGFRVEESMALLRQHQRTSGRSRLALLLPGGGVKAAYQSRLVDELYQKRYLENELEKDGADPGALEVNLVVGTSGGALLGYFVARLAEKGPWTLSEVLWEKAPGIVMDSSDVFGVLDLPRYVSVLAIFLTFAALLALLSLPHRPLIKVGPPPERGAWRLRLWLTLWPVILFIPVLVRKVNGSFSQEHVPEIEGIFYVVCASIAMFADQCLILRTGEEAGERRKPLVHPVLPALAGLVLVAVPLLPVWGKEENKRWIDQPPSLPAGAFLVCLGCLCLLAAAFLSTYSSHRYRLEGSRDFGTGFSLSVLHVFAVYGVLVGVLTLWPGRFSLLEMTGAFWGWLLLVAFGLGALLVAIGCFRRQGTICRGIRFLCSHHPNGSLVSRRFLRLAVITVVALVWWNFVLAPALYGNKHARDFLNGAVTRFEGKYKIAYPGRDPHHLTAQLLVPANALKLDGTRYFLMVPDTLPNCPSVASRPGSGASWHQYRVGSRGLRPSLPNCPKVLNVSSEDVKKIVFASGSPFPIFPAHLVQLPDEKEKQALVDGGYSSNVPVDAARTVAAEQVLIVESEYPLERPKGTAKSWWSELPHLPGPLVADILQLPGYLFERSQQVDRLSKRDLFVLSLSPSRDEEDWPLLIDFRKPVVERMRNVAQEDLERRIGLVESWGPPRFQLSVQVGTSGASAR